MNHDHTHAGPDCCAPAINHKAGFDVVLWGSLAVITAALAAYYALPGLPWVQTFGHSVIALIGTMWWGVLIGMFFVGLMSKVPREYFQVMMGRGDSVSGLLRAIAAGILLDLCSHGILLIGAKLYERGVSLAQIMAFLIASPWNSFSLTIILISLIGLQWTLLFIAASCAVAFITGLIYMALVKRGILPENPNTMSVPDDFCLKTDARRRLKKFKLSRRFFIDIARSGLHDGQMLVRWLLLGIVIAAALQTFIPADDFTAWFGPTMLGLGLTLIISTIMEVCSEGSAPIAAVILNRAGAPGNAFAFLMAGVSTDYTEMFIIRQMTGSWKIALTLPLFTVPQILILAMIMNMAS